MDEPKQPKANQDILHVAGKWAVLYGNPNTGKTSLFNRLTGLHQKIGNYPGVTIERKEGQAIIDGEQTRVIDLPGTYSLAARSRDEEVAIDVLSGRWSDGKKPDAAVCVVDINQLKRHLLVALQVADLEVPQVIAVNFSDEARKNGIEFDAEKLSRQLGVPVVCTVAATGEGIEELKNAISSAMDKRLCMPPIEWGDGVQEAVQCLRSGLEAMGVRGQSDIELRRALFDNNSIFLRELPLSLEQKIEIIDEARDCIRKEGTAPHILEPIVLKQRVDELVEGCVHYPEKLGTPFTHKLDPYLLHPVMGSAVFLGVMFLLFQAVYAWAGPLMDLIDGATGWCAALASNVLADWPLLQSLVADGIIAGVGSVLIFLPQILILYAIVAVLEDSGYLARPAYLMDRLFSWTGMNGKSFVPLLSSFACAIPGIMAARTIEDPKARLSTSFVAPLMSCSARLPVYVLLIGAFIEPVYGAFWAGIALFGMHFLGLLVALPLALILNRLILKTPSIPFLLELPPYRNPHLRDVFWKVFERGKKFVTNAGTVIFAFSIIIWALLYFPRSEAVESDVTKAYLDQKQVTSVEALSESEQAELSNQVDAAYIEQSIMGRTGKFIQPVFAPAGFDWKISIAVLASFPAREVIVATLGIIYELGADTDEESESLREKLASDTWKSGPMAGQAVYTMPAVLALLVFYALCMQCGATVAILAKESSWKWGIAAFVTMTSLAWIGAVMTYQVASAWGIA
jgi:ferrous iron transport protein B